MDWPDSQCYGLSQRTTNMALSITVQDKDPNLQVTHARCLAL